MCPNGARYPAPSGPSPPGPAGRPGAGRCTSGGESDMSRGLGAAGRVEGGARGGALMGEDVQVERGPLGPVQFWRGSSRYVVGELLDSWVETAPWWQRATVPGGASA